MFASAAAYPARSPGHFKLRGPLRHKASRTEDEQRMQVKILVWVNHYGWIMGEIRDGGALVGLRFTKARAGAQPYDEGALEEILRDVEGTGCHYDLEREYF